MSKFTKRPVTIEAREWDGSTEGATELINWILESGGTARFVGPFEDHRLRHDEEKTPGHDQAPFIVIDTLEGAHRADIWDWIIQGVAGEFYPCKPEIFALTYSPAASTDSLSDVDAAALARFTSPNFAVQDGRSLGAEGLRAFFHAAALNLLLTAKPTKSRAVALTELETAMMWAVKAYYGAPGEGS